MSIAVPVAGTTKLEKQGTATFIAGTPGRPGTAGSPAVPAHYITVSSVAPSGNNLPVGWSYSLVSYPAGDPNYGSPPRLVPTAPSGFKGAGAAIAVSAGASYTSRVLVPAVAAIASVPAIPAIPSQTLISVNAGWNTSARTAFELTSAGRYDFFAPQPLVGAVVGLSSIATVDYARLTHALYLEHGAMQVCESGTLLPRVSAYQSSDRLTIAVDPAGVVRYQQNGTTLYRSTVACPFFVRLVACLYVAGDAIYDVASARASTDAASVLRPMQSFALDVGGNFVATGLAPISGEAGNLANHASLDRGGLAALRGSSFGMGLDHPANYVDSALPVVGGGGEYAGHTARAVLPAIGGYGASARYGFATSVLPAVVGHSGSGGLIPLFASAESVIAPLFGGGLALLTRTATITSVLPPLTGVAASSARYGAATSRLPALIGQAFNRVGGYGYVGAVMTATARLELRQHLITGVFSRGTARFTFVGRIALPMSMRERVLISDAFTMRDRLFLSIASTVQAIEGTTSALVLMQRLIAMIASTATVADRLTLQQALYVMMAERLALDGMRAGSGSGNAPGDFQPVGLVAPSGQTWVVNLDGSNQPSSRYEDFDFDSFAMIGGAYYGARADGIYRLDGDTDDGKPVVASVDFGDLKFGSLGLKRPTNAYVGATSSGALVMKVEAEGEEYLYVARESSADAATQRFDFGKGLSGNFLNFELFNGSGEDFELESIEFMVVPLSRRVHG